MATQSNKSRMSQIGDESRQRILDAAEQLFLEKGYERTTLADVGRVSGISYGSIPWHFQNKQGLLVAVAERHWDASEVEAFSPGLVGLDDIFIQMESWDNSPISALVSNIIISMADSESDAYRRVLERDEKRHQDLIDWIKGTMNGREILGGHTPESLAHFWISSSRGIFLMSTYFGEFHKQHRPRAVLRQAIISLMGIEEP